MGELVAGFVDAEVADVLRGGHVEVFFELSFEG